MAATFTWSIPTVERNLSDGGVTVAHWRCTGEEGDNSAATYGTQCCVPEEKAEGKQSVKGISVCGMCDSK